MKLMSDELFELLKKTSNFDFRLVKTPDFECAEYDMKLNLFTFCKFSLPISLTMIAFPASICKKGYVGDVYKLIEYYKQKRGIYLILNDDEPLDKFPERSGYTLPACIFENKYESFEQYFQSLRSTYRRRLKIALNKGKNLEIKKIKREDFSDNMYQLYLNVLNSSKYCLETLKPDFFKLFDGEIYAFYKDEKPVAFVLLKQIDNILYFVFGGIDYKYRDAFDLYYNMLLFIVKKGISSHCEKIDFGQTAEISKMRVGCVLQKKYMHVVSGCKIKDFILTKLIKILEYKLKIKPQRVFKV